MQPQAFYVPIVLESFEVGMDENGEPPEDPSKRDSRRFAVSSGLKV